MNGLMNPCACAGRVPAKKKNAAKSAANERRLVVAVGHRGYLSTT
jgi:hypothetical protein